jgi:hypothetical protein
MNPRLWLSPICVALVATGCQSIHVRSNYDHAVAFANFHTFCWVAPPAWFHNDPRLHMDFLEPLVKNVLESGLTAKGFRSSDCDSADFQITFRPALKDRSVRPASFDNEKAGVTVYEYSPSTGGRLWTSSSDAMLYDEREGSLVVEILHPKTHRVLWKGVASANLKSQATDAQREQRVRTAVHMIMDRFPPPLPK